MLAARRPKHRNLPWSGAVLILLCLSGCAFGPYSLERSHGRYNEAVRRVDEEQLLRNLVHMRYNEIPLNLKVASIAAQYELAGQAEARPFFEAPNPAGGTFRSFTSVLPDLSISGANRPTLTLLPADDGEAVQKFLTPITVDTLILLQQSSWPVSTVLRLWVERLNGVPNAATASGPQRDLLPDFARFRRAVELIQKAQDLGLGVVRPVENLVEVGGPLPVEAMTSASSVEAVKHGLEYRPRSDGVSWGLVRKESRLILDLNPAALGHPVTEEIVGLLNLRPGQLQYAIVVSPGMVPDPLMAAIPPSGALQTTLRSTSQVYFYLANGVEVPCDHLDAGLVRLPTGPDGLPVDGRVVTDGLFTVRASPGHKPPATAFLAIKYRDYWYWVDDRDQETKATFALVLSLSRLDFARQQPGGPMLTLPVGR